MEMAEEVALIARQLADLTTRVAAITDTVTGLVANARDAAQLAETQQARIDLAAQELVEVSERPHAAASNPRRRHRPVDGQQRRLLRQRCRRELLRDLEEGADQPPHLALEGRAAHPGLRLHRGLLQPRTTPQHPRTTLPSRLREDQPLRHP